MKEKWFIKNKKGNFEQIGQYHHIDPVIARLIVNRGINSNEELAGYLHPSLENMHDPHQMKDLDKACHIIVNKIKEEKTIRIIGDYDVDGVMSTYILITGLKRCGAKVDYEIPDRIKDGYGINIDIINAAYEAGIDTILTCDNGIAAKNQIAFAKEHGLTVIVTDHHDIPMEEGVPDADAVVNPKQEDCSYPYESICGAVVALKLVQVLYDMCGIDTKEFYDLLEFAAIATVCDVMDLCDENRIIVKYGIQKFESTSNIGLNALKEACGLLGKPISAYHFGFIIGPCINASGRLESAKLSLRLLLCQDTQEAKTLAVRLKELNDERKSMTEENLKKAIEIVENSNLTEDKVLVVFLENCHESLAGIIAGRLRERYNKPTIVLTRAEGAIKGSGRSIEEYHMFEELTKCKDLLSKFGGHPMAAGLSLPEENVEKLRQGLNQKAELTEEDLMLKVSFDMVLPLEKVSVSLISQMDLLEPYGKGNAKPLFALKDAQVSRAQVLGANKNVLKLSLCVPGSRTIYTAMIFLNILGFEEAIDQKYGAGSFETLMSGRQTYEMDIIFSLNLNEYNGMVSPQLIIQNYR